MRIACVDSTAADRVALQKMLDRCCTECRTSIGHLSLIQTYPATKEEVLVNAAPEVIAVGSSFSIEEAYAVCRDLHSAHPAVPLIVFLSPERYSLRSLRRFGNVSDEVFSTEDPSIRIIHKLSSFDTEDARGKGGKLVTVVGVKGGVGATSVVSGLAHAAEAVGKKAVVLDLSAASVFAYYMSAQRWQSADYAAALVDGVSPDKTLVERCLTTAPNGISILLPPSGGSEVRDLWLRDATHFVVTLSMIEILMDQFDIVLVDIAGVEGVLQFALQCRADSKLLVTSNDPASVHLLNTMINKLAETPGEGDIQVLINNSNERGLSYDDVLDFLYYNKHFEEDMVLPNPLPFDLCARNWIGTGNSFYTEGAKNVQKILEAILLGTLNTSEEVRPVYHRSQGLLDNLKRFVKKPRLQKKLETPRKALPFHEPEHEELQSTPLLRPAKAEIKSDTTEIAASSVKEVWKLNSEPTDDPSTATPSEELCDALLPLDSANEEKEGLNNAEDEHCIYQPPKLLINE